VLQMHYHPAGRAHPVDTPRIDLRLTGQQPQKQLLFVALGNAPSAPQLLPGPDDDGTVEFKIPAGISGHTETMQSPVTSATTQPSPILSLLAPSHYTGVDESVTIPRASPPPGEPAQECLAEVPHWSFDWQRNYLYDAPIDQLPTVGDGDQVTIRCLY